VPLRSIDEKITSAAYAKYFETILRSQIPDVTPILAAANKALIAESRGKLVTRTIYSEMIFNVSGSKHITEALKKWGISDSSTGLVVAMLNVTPEEVLTRSPFRLSLSGANA
jgi:tRNA threonylcarbamoyladenosine modification (KEOPS) complex Cgi121 subunit